MLLVPASLDTPAGLLDFLEAARADQWLFDSDLPYLDQGLDEFLQRNVDFARGRNLPGRLDTCDHLLASR
jgi:hypothetical protein